MKKSKIPLKSWICLVQVSATFAASDLTQSLFNFLKGCKKAYCIFYIFLEALFDFLSLVKKVANQNYEF